MLAVDLPRRVCCVAERSFAFLSGGAIVGHRSSRHSAVATQPTHAGGL